MKRAFYIILFVFLLANCSSAQKQEDDIYGRKDNFLRICSDPVNLIKFFQEGKLCKNISENSKSIPAFLEKEKIFIKKKTEINQLRVGARYFEIKDLVFWDHFEGENQKYWIDIVRFTNKDTCKSSFGKYRRNQIYSGLDAMGAWSFMTYQAKEGLNALDVLIMRDDLIFNFGVSIPFIINGENNIDEKTERNYIYKSIDTLMILIEKTALSIVEPGNENSVPPAFPDKKAARLLRLESLARLWSEVKYNFVFTDRLKELDWDNLLGKYMSKMDSVNNYVEYINILKEFIALLKDGHTTVYGGNSTDQPGIEIQPIEGKPVVTALGTTAELKASKIKIGMELVRVNKKPVSEILSNKLYPYIFASTNQDRDIRAFEKLLEYEPGSTILAAFKDINGKEIEVPLKCNMSKKYDSAAWVRSPKPIETKELDNNIMYVAINSFNSNYIVKEFDKVFEKVLNSKGMIIDIRKNGGGNSKFGYDIMAKMIDKKCDLTSKWKTRMYKPTSKAWKEKEEWFEGNHGSIEPGGEKQFPGPVVILIGPKTFSAAEDFLIPFKSSRRAKLVGMPTAGSTGQPLMVNLYDASARICTKWDYFPDGTEFVGVGIQPDVKVEPKIKDIIDGRDVVLEKGIEVLKEMMKGKK